MDISGGGITLTTIKNMMLEGEQSSCVHRAKSVLRVAECAQERNYLGSRGHHRVTTQLWTVSSRFFSFFLPSPSLPSFLPFFLSYFLLGVETITVITPEYNFQLA